MTDCTTQLLPLNMTTAPHSNSCPAWRTALHSHCLLARRTALHSYCLPTWRTAPHGYCLPTWRTAPHSHCLLAWRTAPHSYCIPKWRTAPYSHCLPASRTAPHSYCFPAWRTSPRVQSVITIFSCWCRWCRSWRQDLQVMTTGGAGHDGRWSRSWRQCQLSVGRWVSPSALASPQYQWPHQDNSLFRGIVPCVVVHNLRTIQCLYYSASFIKLTLI